MEEYKLNIPSVISHSYFTLFGEITHLNEREINYFYSLLYLFRKNIIDECKVKIFNKIGKNKSEINENFENFTVKIELIEFNDLGVVSKNTYNELKSFFRELKDRELVVNILGKDKTIDIQSIKLIESYKIENNILHIKFTEDLLYLILHSTEYFMVVDLKLLFKINGYKSKKLYLIIKDYSKFYNECIKISKENLERLIGKIPSSKKSMENVIKNTYEIKTIVEKEERYITSDLKIEYPTINGRKLKKYEFRFKNLVEGNPIKGLDDKQFSTSIKEIPQTVKDEVDKRIDKKIKSGEKIVNLDGYKKSSYQTEMKKNQPKEKTITETQIDKWITEEKSKYDIDKTQRGNPKIIINGMFWIDSNYSIKNPFGEYLSKTPKETIEKLQSGLLRISIDSSNGFDKDMSKMYFLTEDEIRMRGFI